MSVPFHCTTSPHGHEPSQNVAYFLGFFEGASPFFGAPRFTFGLGLFLESASGCSSTIRGVSVLLSKGLQAVVLLGFELAGSPIYGI